MRALCASPPASTGLLHEESSSCRRKAVGVFGTGAKRVRRYVAQEAMPASEVASSIAAAQASTAQFEPRFDASAAASMGIVLLSVAASAAYWWGVVVPSERASLGRSKRRGAVKAYLDELQGDEGRVAERWFYTDWLDQKREREDRVAAFKRSRESFGEKAAGESSSGAPESDRNRREEEDGYTTVAPASRNPLVPSYRTPMPAFFSLDNPIVFVGSALLALSIVASALSP